MDWLDWDDEVGLAEDEQGSLSEGSKFWVGDVVPRDFGYAWENLKPGNQKIGALNHLTSHNSLTVHPQATDVDGLH
jgi:hypothetical protein